MDFDTYINEPLPFDSELGRYLGKRDSLTIFEIGSCEGEDTIRLKKRFPNSTVYTFEPLPNNIARIKRNLAKYGLSDRHLYKIALSNVDGNSEFHVSSGHPKDLPKSKTWNYGNKSSSLLPPKEHIKVLDWVKFNNKIKVKTQRLDSFCKQHEISAIDFVFIDVQGAELLVLEGAGKLLDKIGAVWMEVEAIELYKNQPLKKDVEMFMKKNNFIKIVDTVDNISGDQLYVRKDLKPRNRLINSIKRLREN